jgi:hypothetical protein
MYGLSIMILIMHGYQQQKVPDFISLICFILQAYMHYECEVHSSLLHTPLTPVTNAECF